MEKANDKRIYERQLFNNSDFNTNSNIAATYKSQSLAEPQEFQDNNHSNAYAYELDSIQNKPQQFETMRFNEERYNVDEEQNKYYQNYNHRTQLYGKHDYNPRQSYQPYNYNPKQPSNDKRKAIFGKKILGTIKLCGSRTYRCFNNHIRTVNNREKIIKIGFLVITVFLIYKFFISNSNENSFFNSINLSNILTFDNFVWICVIIACFNIMWHFYKNRKG